MEVSISDWDLICEVNRRMEANDIFMAGNGKLWPRRCPCCGDTVREYTVQINYPWETLKKFSFTEWEKFARPILDSAGRHLPMLSIERPGKFYFVRCEGFCSGTCKSVNFRWFGNLEDAREDFFSYADMARALYGGER